MSAGETTVIVDYGSGNLHSAEKAFQRAAAAVGGTIMVSPHADDVAKADRIVLPGVGAFGDCAAGVAAADGLRDALEERVRRGGAPFFGICVGMQLMATRGTERGIHAGFDWIPGSVDAMTPDDPSLKVPHMGWNRLEAVAEHPVLAGLGPDPFVYFVHGFHLVPERPEDRLARADYGGPLTAMVGRDTLVGTQFHPEKSQHVGGRIIENFLRWRP